MKYLKTLMGAAVGVLLTGASIESQALTNIVTTPLSGTNNWYRTNTYVLSGMVHVLSNGVLNVEAGTVIKGRNTGSSPEQKGALMICTGAKIYAEGTPTQPIIFTAEADNVADPEDLGIYDRGLWGGVFLMGLAPLNSAADLGGNTANPVYEFFEGLTASVTYSGQLVHRFGGTNVTDNSGVMRYVSIRHGGAVIEANKEINGLSLCGVGNGTTVEYIETYATADDGFEFFGGTVNTKHLISAFNDDDAFDADQGHQGKHQFWLAVQPPDKRNYGFEFNGEVSNTTGANPRSPQATWQIYNATIIGAGVGNAGTGGNNDAMLLREFAQPGIYNSIFTEFGRRGIDTNPKGDYGITNALTKIQNNIWWGFTGGVNPNSATNLAIQGTSQVLWTNASFTNLIVNPLLAGISRTNNGGLDPRPLAGSPALDAANIRATPKDGFYSQVAYQGAFGDKNWASDWTALGAYGIISAHGAGESTEATAILPNAPIILVGTAGGNIQLSFATQSGVTYQVQSAAVLTGAPGDWSNVGSTIAGDGSSKSFSELVGANNKFYRVLAR